MINFSLSLGPEIKKKTIIILYITKYKMVLNNIVLHYFTLNDILCVFLTVIFCFVVFNLNIYRYPL